MKSRTVHTCENILKNLIREYGPFARIAQKLVEKAVIVKAGGDPRTVNRYFEQMKLLEFIQDDGRGLFTLNWKKVDFAQLSLHESLIEVKEEPP